MIARHAHYIRPAGSTSVPRHHLVLDTEARQDRHGQGWEQSWRLAAGAEFHGYAGRAWSTPAPRFYGRPFELWADVHSLARPGHRLIVWTHNLSYDLRISQALPFLSAMGYQLEGLALDHAAGWARFQREDQTVMFVDLLAWLPAPLHRIARALGLPVSPLLALDADDERWRERCENDVRITTVAVQSVLDTVAGAELGPWRPTGSGQSHSAWRRRFLTARPLVHDDLRLLELEREAQWTGRCEAWRWGALADGPFHELDLSLAYCQIAASCDVPSVLVGPTALRDPVQLLANSDRTCVLARVRVTTDRPVLPAMRGEHMLWPVGTFETAVWDPELRLAIDAGARIEVLDAYVYRRAPVLRDVARWIIEQLASPDELVTPARKIMLKHWARALVGRCALRYRNWEDWGEADDDSIRLGTIEFRPSGRVTDMLQVGSRIKVLSDTQESPDSLPQIPGWIMSECRRRLWSLLTIAGAPNVVYVDTDALIVTSAGRERLEAQIGGGIPWPVHVKGTYSRVIVHGPRILEVDDARRMAGVPLRAELDQSGQLRSEVFASLKQSLVTSQLSSVQVVTRKYDPAGLDRRRRHLPGGFTEPFRLPELTAAPPA